MGESTLSTTLLCLPTLVRYSADPLTIIVHEDGSLSSKSRELLQAAVPGVEFVNRRDADDAVNGSLARYPNCRAARDSNIMFLKMFDVALLEPGDLAYCDSDILFLRPFQNLFPDCTPGPAALFMTDSRHGYAVRPWQLSPLGKIRLAGHSNAGLMRIKKGFLDLDYVEWLLKRLSLSSAWARRKYWHEQTCWAALGGRAGCALWDRNQIVMATRDMRGFSNESVAIHFVSTYRNHLQSYLPRSSPEDVPPVLIRSRQARRIGPFAQAVSDLKARYS
jgi:hypothetical protein